MNPIEIVSHLNLFPNPSSTRFNMCFTHITNSVSPSPSPSSLDMEDSVFAVENIINYTFQNKTILEEALTHPSYIEFPSYQRLEFVGDAVLGLAFTNHVFLAYPDLDPGQLSLLRSSNISTEKLARVALRHGFYHFLRHSAPSLNDKVKEFADAVIQDDDGVAHGGSVKAPKVLADIVESIAGAVYVDMGFDLQRLWVIFRGLLEPIVTLDGLKQQPQPVTMLFELCQKQGKEVDIIYWKKDLINIASVYVDGNFVTSGSSEQKNIAKLEAAKAALLKLGKSMSNDKMMSECNSQVGGQADTESIKQKLNTFCSKKKWPKPLFNIEKDTGPSHEKKFECSVQMTTPSGVLFMIGEEKPRVKDAESSAASMMIRALQESGYL